MANRNIYSVAQVNSYIKNMFAQDFMLRQVSIKGEVSNCKYHTSGHIYFTIKDAGAAMNAIMFAGSRAAGLSFHMKEGDQVIVTGSVEVYEKTGAYQLYAKKIELDGEGNLYLKFEQLKHELEEMGMFAAEYKQPIPQYAGRIGVVTAPTGAAVQDIRNVSSRRNPYVQVILYPALVQGEGAANSIVKGIQTLDAMNLDVIIVGRGGGSIEDLWAFNEIEVADAIYYADTPIISGTGHEIDMTIADYCADVRAATPSAACELAIPDMTSFYTRMHNYQEVLGTLLQQKLMLMYGKTALLERQLEAQRPDKKLMSHQLIYERLEGRLQQAMRDKYQSRQQQFTRYVDRLSALSPTSRLRGGYVFAQTKEGNPLTSAGQIEKENPFFITFSDGQAEVMPVSVKKNKK